MSDYLEPLFESSALVLIDVQNGFVDGVLLDGRWNVSNRARSETNRTLDPESLCLVGSLSAGGRE